MFTMKKDMKLIGIAKTKNVMLGLWVELKTVRWSKMEGMNRTIPKLPDEYKGKVSKKDKHKRNNDRLWKNE